MPLIDENGNRIRGKDNKEATQVALARVKLSKESETVNGDRMTS